MTTMADLQNAVSQLLSTYKLPSGFIFRRNAPDAAYEAYIFTLILKAIKQAGGTVQLRSIHSPNRDPRTFIFRGSPGYLFSSGDDYGYASCNYNGNEFEVHIDVQHYGSSKVLHEVDVSIIDKAEGDRCRTNKTHPTASKTRGAFECKFYSRFLGTSLIRTFVGLTDDMGQLKVSRFVTNFTSKTIARYCTGKTTRPRFTELLIPLNPNIETQFICSVVDDLKAWLA